MRGDASIHHSKRRFRAGVILLSLFALTAYCFVPPAAVRAAEVIPPAPTQYFNDYAHVVPPSDADNLNNQLAQFERDTSNQIVVAVYSKMQSDSNIADYTFRVKESWRVGQKKKNNGAILFVFIQDKKIFIQVNYGLEGALPDATCKEIIDQKIMPRFKAGDYAGGLRAGINAILAATRGEYKGSGSTVAESQIFRVNTKTIFHVFVAAIGSFVILGLLLLYLNYFGGTYYQRHVRALSFLDNAYLFILQVGLNFLFSGGGSSRGGSSGESFGSSSFSGGGGTGGGGGAGGSW